MKPSDVLTAALMYLSQGHWIQGSYHDHKGGCCLVGSLQLAAYGSVFARANYDLDLAKKWAYRYIEEAVEPGNPDAVSLEDWNDVEGRSLTQVQLALSMACHIAMKKGE